MLNKKLDEDIIEENAKCHQQKIPEKLHPSAENGAGKNDVPVQQVACGK
jgi:hypothetical protein